MYTVCVSECVSMCECVCVCVCVLLRDFCLFLPTSFQKGTFMFSGELEYLDHKMIGSDIIFFTPKALKHLMYIEKETF